MKTTTRSLIALGLLVFTLGCGGSSATSADSASTGDMLVADGVCDDVCRGPDASTLADGVLDANVGDLDQPAGDVRIEARHLVLVGSFRIPSGDFGSPQWTGFSYGGTALAYNAANDSLYLVGHDHHQLVAEIAVPEIVKADTLDQLKTATVLQSFVDVTEGALDSVDDGTVKIGGLLVWGGKLYGTAYSYYDADGNQTLSSFVHDLDLTASGTFEGFYQVGTLGAGLVSGYMTPIPPAWRDKLGGPVVIGQCCIPIVSRTSYGPAAFVFDPAQLGQTTPAPAAPLVYYPDGHPLAAWDSTGTDFNGSTQLGGVVFPVGSRSLLFIGRQGSGTFCYGTGTDCADPTDDSKGNHAYPYRGQVWAYDVEELLAVRSGAKQPWEIVPYATFELSLPFETGSRVIQGVAYDAARQRIFIALRNADGDLPLVHVLSVQLD